MPRIKETPEQEINRGHTIIQVIALFNAEKIKKSKLVEALQTSYLRAFIKFDKTNVLRIPEDFWEYYDYLDISRSSSNREFTLSIFDLNKVGNSDVDKLIDLCTNSTTASIDEFKFLKPWFYYLIRLWKREYPSGRP